MEAGAQRFLKGDRSYIKMTSTIEVYRETISRNCVPRCFSCQLSFSAAAGVRARFEARLALLSLLRPSAYLDRMYPRYATMSGLEHAVLDWLEPSLAKYDDDYDPRDSLPSSSGHSNSDNEAYYHAQIRAQKQVTQSPNPHKHTHPSKITPHPSIFVVNEQITHAKTTWSTTLTAFTTLSSANTAARTRAVTQHANGDASAVQAQYRNGCGTWTVTLETPRGRITKSVFVNAAVLQQDEQDVEQETTTAAERLGPGEWRVRKIRAFRSTDSIRAAVRESGRMVDALRGNLAREDRGGGDARVVEEAAGKKREMQTQRKSATREERLSKEERFTHDLHEFASLRTLL